MATTKRSDLIVPQLLEEALSGAFDGMQCLYGSGAASIAAGLPGEARGGDTITFPYFGNLGELDDLAAEGDSLTPVKISESSETATVQHSGKAFETTEWARMAANADPYVEARKQIQRMVQRRADQELITKATASGLPSSQDFDVYNAGSPAKLTWSRIVDARMAFGDEQDAALMLVHSKVYGDLLKEVDGQSRPLLTDANGAGLSKVAGIPVKMSDRCPVEFATITSSGTTPPVLTVSGQTTLAINQLRIECTTLGARGTWVLRVSYNGGSSWEMSSVLSAATVSLTKNGSPTGLTLNIAVGTAAVDNVWVGTPKYSSILIKPGALGFWYNGSVYVDTDKDILSHKTLTATHVYFAAHRYLRMPGSNRPGVVRVRHN